MQSRQVVLERDASPVTTLFVTLTHSGYTCIIVHGHRLWTDTDV